MSSTSPSPQGSAAGYAGPFPWHYHVALLPTRLSVPGAFTAERIVFYDELHRMCLSVNLDRLDTFDSFGEHKSYRFHAASDVMNAPVRAIRLDWDLKHAAIVYELVPTNVHIVSLETGRVTVSPCRRPKGNRIRYLCWTRRHNLLVVTISSVELYQLANEKLRLLKEMRIPVRWCTFSSSAKVLLLSVGDTQSSVIQPLFFRVDTIVKLPRFEVEAMGGHSLTKESIVPCLLYGKLYCIHVHEAARTCVLYQIRRESVVRKYSIGLNLIGPMTVQCVDNLLVLHNLDAHISVVYDILSRDPVSPLVEPLPVAVRPLDESARAHMLWMQNAAVSESLLRDSSSHLSSEEESEAELTRLGLEPYSTNNRYLMPNTVMCMSGPSITLWELFVSLEELALSFPDSDLLNLVWFLLRRSQRAKAVLLRKLRDMLERQTPLDVVGKVFDVIALVEPTPNSASATGPGAVAMAPGSPTLGGGLGASLPGSSSAKGASAASSAGSASGSSSILSALPIGGAFLPSFLTPGSSGLSAAAASSRASAAATSASMSLLGGGSAGGAAAGSVSAGEYGYGGAAGAQARISNLAMASDSALDLAILGGEYGAEAWSSADGSASASGLAASGGMFAIPPVPRGSSAGSIREWGYAITQADMYVHVFSPLDDLCASSDRIPHTYLLGVLVEYIRSLKFMRKRVDHGVFKLVIDVLVRNKMFFQLHLYLQYHVIADSVEVACQLLALHDAYPASTQLAFDMFKRLQCLDRILEVLLARNQLVLALKLIREVPKLKYSRSDILQAALSSGDVGLFVTVYDFFFLRGDIGQDPECQSFLEEYNKLRAKPIRA